MAERVEYIELFWRCPECGQDRISAIPHLNSTGWYCPSCFFRRDDSVELYEAPDSKIITDPDLITRIEEGRADWECKHCGSLNPDTGVSRELLKCEVCEMWQTNETDSSAPIRDQSGEEVAKRTEAIDRFENPVVPRSLEQREERSPLSSPKLAAVGKAFAWGLSIAAGAIGIAYGGWWLLTPRPLEVEVKELPWSVSVEVQQLRPVERSGWDETVPVDARILASETRQRGTQTVQRGTKTILVDERYQSGTRTETYTEQERYQSGTKENCTTTTTGTGAGKRTCVDVPVYSTRPVQRSRQVPEYSTRQVPKTVPNMVTEPVYDTYVFYEVNQWLHKQTLTNTGVDDQPRIAPVLEQRDVLYPERTLPPVTSCQLTGAYTKNDEQTVQTWKIPCNQFDLIDTGDKVKLLINRGGQATLEHRFSHQDPQIF